MTDSPKLPARRVGTTGEREVNPWDGWLVDSGRRRKGSSGAEATVWVLSERGHKELCKR